MSYFSFYIRVLLCRTVDVDAPGKSQGPREPDHGEENDAYGAREEEVGRYFLILGLSYFQLHERFKLGTKTNR